MHHSILAYLGAEPRELEVGWTLIRWLFGLLEEVERVVVAVPRKNWHRSLGVEDQRRSRLGCRQRSGMAESGHTSFHRTRMIVAAAEVQVQVARVGTMSMGRRSRSVEHKSKAAQYSSRSTAPKLEEQQVHKPLKHLGPGAWSERPARSQL